MDLHRWLRHVLAEHHRGLEQRLVELREGEADGGGSIAMASNLIAMAFNLEAMSCNLEAMASNLIAMASNLIGMASNLIVMASNLQVPFFHPWMFLCKEVGVCGC